MKKTLKDWTLFEKIWLTIFTVINLYLFFAWGDSLLGLTASITGMLCVVLVAKGKISNYYFGIIQTSIYAYLSYSYGLYGEAMLNGLFYFPMQFIGFYFWNRNRVKNSSIGEEVRVKRLTGNGWIYIILTVAILTFLYALFLKYIGGRSVGIDSATNVLSITAQILMLKRYAEQWLIWISVNILSIIMWAITLSATGGSDYAILVMWTAFLVNSIYGYYNWTKMYKKQKDKVV